MRRGVTRYASKTVPAAVETALHAAAGAHHHASQESRMSLLRGAIATLACVQLTACLATSNARSIGEWELGPGSLPPVQIEVLNSHTSEVTAFLMRGPERQRLGTVIPGRSTRFQVPARLVLTGQDLRLMVEPIDRSWACASEPFVTRPGERAAFSLERNEQLWRLP
jgi:hypothetical protein